MPDNRLSPYLQYGTTAERTAFTPNPPSAFQIIYLWWDTDLSALYAWDGSSWNAVGGGSGGVWELAGSWTFSTNVTEVDFDVSGYTAIQVIIRGITLGTNGRPILRFSTDGGSTFYSTSGDYLLVSVAGVTSNTTGAFVTTLDATAARTAMLSCDAINVNGAPKVIFNYNRVAADSSQIVFVASNSPITDIRIVPSNAGNITGGSIFVYGLPL